MDPRITRRRKRLLKAPSRPIFRGQPRAVWRSHEGMVVRMTPPSRAGTRARFTVQTPAVKRPLGLMLALALVVAASAAACKRQIGDDCKTATDCDPNGARACDLSQPGGYCTIQGCDETTCPSEATCIRYFPAQFLSKSCNPSCEDHPAPDASCPDAGPGTVDDAGVVTGATNDCTADEICLNSGLCAPRSTELRFCVKVCGSDSDCRGGYECRLAGRGGSMALSSTVGASTSFCAPNAAVN
jgi:hypothetical protein